MKSHIRNLVSMEAAVAARMVGALMQELSPGYETDEVVMAETARALLGQGRIVGLLAWDGDDPVGVLMLNECAALSAGGLFGEITELYVRPSHRSRGIAAQMVARARDLAKARGWKRLEVGAPEEQAWARTKSFYEREGFVEVGPRLKCAV
ncbi:MAG: GNAT family N-acetyltransferase [Rhodobacteraceae bacterium]|nr:GNAT family N-acetyltransferase [Paracoccaceae bacterium]